jgi:asparagine synthase (glutamine-hydrolysing)
MTSRLDDAVVAERLYGEEVCGIAGATATSHGHDVERAVASLAHRGPDAFGIRSEEGCVLGHTRLRIIDLSPLGDQPMGNADGSIQVAFNGEIYNFAELRADLVGRGHVFRSSSDTEVIVHLYEEVGDDLVHRLRGMFAFALWDARRRRLLLVRDRLGVKPLYVRRDGTDVVFASEVRALARRDGIAASSVATYLTMGWVAGPTSILAGIEELPPGHQMIWESGRTEVVRWWAGPDADATCVPLDEALSDAVRSHLVADVPVGVFLSSGVDSALVAALAADARGGEKTFTVAFDGEGEDEADGARRIAEHLGMEHEVVPVPGSDVLAALDRIIADMDQPTVDGVNSWVISRAVREAGVVVALSGLGGDELFSGYSTFRHVPRIHRAGARLPRTANAAASVLGLVAGSAQNRMQRAVDAAGRGTWEAAYAAVRGTFGHGDVLRLWPIGAGLAPVLSRPWGLNDDQAVAELELANYLPWQLLRDTDAMSMAHSLEVRVPLLDDRLVDTVAAHRFTLTKGDALAAAAPGLAPLVSGPKKTFTLPFGSWMRGPLRDRTLSALACLGDADLGFDRRVMTALWDGFIEGDVGWRSVWTLAVLGMWIDRHQPRPGLMM